MNLPKGYPLAWPEDWTRTEPHKRNASLWKVSTAVARDELERELKLFGAREFVVTANLPLRLDGRPLSGTSEPRDPGVSVWWVDPKNRVTRVVACDAWRTVRENMRAVGKTVEAMRTMERAKAGQALERMVESFAAATLPPPRPAWADVLDVRAPYSLAQIEAAYKTQAKRRHPDQGGTHEGFLELQRAYQAGLAHCAHESRTGSNGARA